MRYRNCAMLTLVCAGIAALGMGLVLRKRPEGAGSR